MYMFIYLLFSCVGIYVGVILYRDAFIYKCATHTYRHTWEHTQTDTDTQRQT